MLRQDAADGAGAEAGPPGDLVVAAPLAAQGQHRLPGRRGAGGALVALWVSSRWGIGSVDAVVALVASGMLAFGATRIGKGAWDALMDRAADPEVQNGIAAITRDWPGVRGFHDLKTRTAGSRIFVNLHIELDGDQSLREAHEIGASLRRAILSAYPQADVIIHKDVARADTTA